MVGTKTTGEEAVHLQDRTAPIRGAVFTALLDRSGGGRRSRSLHQLLLDGGRSRVGLHMENRDQKREQEKDPPKPNGEFGKNRGGLRAEKIIGKPATEGGTKPLTFGTLH